LPFIAFKAREKGGLTMIKATVKEDVKKEVKKVVITSNNERVSTFFEMFKDKGLSYTAILESLIDDIYENGFCSFDLPLLREMAKKGLVSPSAMAKIEQEEAKRIAEEEAKKKAEEEAKANAEEEVKNPPSE
jgi:hypothetical protein